MSSLKGVSEGTEVLIKSTSTGELVVNAITSKEIYHNSSGGDAYCWLSANTDIDITDTRLFIKNLSNKFLVLDRAIINPANVVARYTFGIGTLTTTPTGTLITPVNLNQRFSSSAADAIAYDDETAVADATAMFVAVCSTVESTYVSLDGIILAKNQYIQINQSTECTSGQVAVFGYFTDEIV